MINHILDDFCKIHDKLKDKQRQTIEALNKQWHLDDIHELAVSSTYPPTVESMGITFRVSWTSLVDYAQLEVNFVEDGYAILHLLLQKYLEATQDLTSIMDRWSRLLIAIDLMKTRLSMLDSSTDEFECLFQLRVHNKFCRRQLQKYFNHVRDFRRGVMEIAWELASKIETGVLQSFL